MDYDYILEKVYKKTEFFIIKKFKEFKADNRTFIYSIDEIRVCISNYNYGGIIGNNNSLFESCHKYYNQHNAHYEKGTPISKTIDTEVKDEFIRATKEKKPLDKNYKEINNYHFNLFIHDLIKYDFLRKVETRLSENSDLYKLYYENEDYTDFTLEKFDGHVINSELYKKLFSKFYPDKNIPIAIIQTNDYGSVTYKIIDKPEKKDTPIINSNLYSKLNKHNFDLDEQLLILNLCLSDNNSIPVTEKAKLIILIGEIKDNSIFTESSSDNTVYHKIIKGILRKGSTQNMLLIINNILAKIDTYDLPITKQTLKKHKTTLISEQNQSK